MCEPANRTELFLKVPNERALRSGFTAYMGARCLECGEELCTLNVTNEDVTVIVATSTVTPEIFVIPLDPGLSNMIEEELGRAIRG